MRRSRCLQQKENCLNSPFEKRRKTVCKDVFGVRQQTPQAPETRCSRPVLTTLLDASPSHPLQTHQSVALEGSLSEACSLSRADVDALLAMKMAGKTKFDFKGKNEQMSDYIKKLRVCIRQFQDQEVKLSFEKENLESALDGERRDREVTEAFRRQKQDELEQGLSELKNLCTSLEDRLMSVMSEKESLLCAREKDMEQLKATGKEMAGLVEELERSRSEATSLSNQVLSLQDLNKRLQEYNTSLQQYNSKLQSDASVSAEACGKLQKEKTTLMETLGSLRGHTAALQEQIDMLKATLQEELKQKKALIDEAERLRAEVQRITDERDQHAAHVQSLMEENNTYKECTGKSAAELEFLSSKAIALEECYTSQTEQVKSLRQQLDVANHKLLITERSYLQERTEVAENRELIEDLTNRLAEADIRIREGEEIRRKLHNTIQEMKGNIRVFCRVRPIFQEEGDPEAGISVVQYPNTTDLLGRGVELVPMQAGQRHFFSFDKVFGPETGQESVFTEISQLVQSALDGYKVCIFAYGQTGSGKTHTMLGNPEVDELRGVIPRSLEQIFRSSQELITRGWTFRMQASMLEIYNEQIRDLLGSGRASTTEGGTPMKCQQQYQVKHDQTGNTYVTDLTMVDVTNWKEVSSLLHRATVSRSVGKTALNEQSSRSHCVFTLRITGSNESTEQEVNGVLNLIDLAGSERLSRSGSTGDRLKETQAINKSLASLGDVIAAIANKEQHVPYRNSKLTYLLQRDFLPLFFILQPCLGGDSKTLMFVNIAPEAKSLHESLCSLRFAAKVNACEIGVPRRLAVAPQPTRLSYE
ncbi:hypothetical protein SELMODRAFT_78149 [Selaginella moellendorffii]|uniref:Kinesin-like protein n=1 Tax=Selaginella moellendorffii TaxID=88036 RepID=D8QU83_SELML|nr:hypothetical protein SELMODRAFT_78149 [Selaginella moellendorffii]